MESTVEGLCNQLARHRLLGSEAIRNLHGKWRGAAGSGASDLGEFRKWLIRNGGLSEFQLDMVARGYGDFLNFGEYRLLERIGTGRMAGVYKAVHPLGQTVAIKVLPPSKAKDPQVLGRFLREARLAVKLDHDNVVRTFQSGQHKDMYYLVMEYLDGETLEETLQRRKRLPINEAVPLLIQALQGLDHLQEIGLVHRDLKPGNLMLVPGENTGTADTTANVTVKILDIGLGRALFDEGVPGTGEAGDLTSDGAILGTLNYMAPEQARSAHTADIRADIYSLGCVMYEMVSGQPPFSDANFARQMRRHAEEKPQSLVELVPGLPAAADQVVQKMLAKDPALRYATPGQALKDVKALVVAAPTAKPVRPMRSYLTWLESQPREATPEATTAGPVPATLPFAVPLAVTATAPLPKASVPAHPSTPSVHGGQMEATASLPKASMPAPTSTLPMASPFQLDTPAIAVARPAKAAGTKPVSTMATDAWGRVRSFGWGKRDWIAAAIGAGAMLLVQILFWMLRALGS